MSLRHVRNVRGFLSDYYLGSLFGGARRKGASGRGGDIAYSRLRRIRDRAEGRAEDAQGFRERFARPFIRDVLGYHLGAGEDEVHGLFASAESEASGNSPLLLAHMGGWRGDLDAGRGVVQPMRHLGESIARAGLRYGILLTGSSARLIRAPGEGPRGAYLEADLEGLCEDDDPESFAAVLRLFGAQSFGPGPDGKAPIEEVERESRLHAEKVSDELKQAVFSAAESLVGGLLADARARGVIVADAASLSAPQLQLYRDAALIALYRLLFVLYAEARDTRLDGHRLYREGYSAQGLLDEILADPLRDWPSNRCSLWQRIRALFRIYDKGLPPVSEWEHIPPRGGDFFSATTREGSLLDAARLPDSDVALLMAALATTAPRSGVGRERVSFRELDIENLGSVYEGILEFEPRVASRTILEVRTQGRTYALAPSELVRLCTLKNLTLKGELSIVRGTEAESLHPQGLQASEEAGAEAEGDDGEEPEDGGEADEGEDPGIRKGSSAVLVRRLGNGDFYFVPGPGRKGTGSFYTPRPLVRDIVRHALAPLVEGRSSTEIERLRILDPACGSAHFLVEAMRFLGQALHRALVEEYRGKTAPGFRSTMSQGWDENWRASDEEARLSNSETRAWCKRRIAERCLFGVDLNPTAVELARVALWIESVAGDRPLTFFEHHIRCGESLQGTWMDHLESPPIPSRNASESLKHPGLFQTTVRECVREAGAFRRAISETRASDLQREGIEPESLAEMEFKGHLHKKAEETLRAARLLFDLRSASLIIPEIWNEWEVLCSFVGAHTRLEGYAKGRAWWDAFVNLRDRGRFFHWELEFPEVFLGEGTSGFDAVLGNPPWDKVLPARKDFYSRHDILIRAFTGTDLDRRIKELEAANPGIAPEFAEYRERTRLFAEFLRRSGDFPHSQARTGAAHEDVSKYFLDRAVRLVRAGGAVGMVIPSVVYNGDGCVGLRKYLIRDSSISRFYGFENRFKIFPIHASYKFVSLVFCKEASEEDTFEAAFMRHDLDELDSTAGRGVTARSQKPPHEAPWMVRLSRREVEGLSPETFAFLELRGPEDQRIIRKMYKGRQRLGSQDASSWKAHLVSWRAHEMIYNATEDKDLWTDPTGGRLFAPGWILGSEPSNVDETIERMRERGFWPVYEGKHVEQFVVGIKPFRWWLSVELAEKKYGRPPRTEPTLVFRETASNTNERTCIAAVLPECSAGAHTLTGMRLEMVNPLGAALILNAFVFDWALRLRTAGTHVSFTYMHPMPVPSPEVIARLPVVPTRHAWQAGIVHISEDKTVWPLLWQSNRGIAEAYGLGPQEFAHILSSFPGFARKRPGLFQYFRQQLEAWKADAR